MADQMYPVGNFDQGGIVIDSDPFALSPTEWSGGRNVRFDNRSVSKIAGESQLLNLGTLSPTTIVNWRQPVAEYYVFTTNAGTTHRVTAGENVTEITKGIGGTPDPLDTTDNANTHASLFNGGYTYLVADGVNVPQYIQAAGTVATELQDIPDFNYDTATYSSVIPRVFRPFRNVLVAANLTYTNATTNAITYAPGTIRISSIAAPGAIPTNWDPAAADPGTAEELEISDTDEIIDMVSFQNNLLIFTRNSIHSMTLTGNDSLPVATRKSLEGRGLLQLNCAKEFYGRVFVVGHEDIYVYSGGSSVESVSDGRVRDYFRSEFNGNLVFVEHNSRQDEMWVFFSTGTSQSANQVLIWNYNHNVWSIRDANEVYAATYGSHLSSGGQIEFIEEQGIIMTNGTQFLFEDDDATGFETNPINAYVERKGFDVVPNATNFSKWTDSIYILATGEGTVDVAVRPTDTPGRPVDFDSTTDSRLKTREFVLNGDMADFKVDPRTNGRYMNIRFGSNDATSSWELIRYNLSFSADDQGRG